MTKGKIFLDVTKTVEAEDDDLDGAADKLIEDLKKLGYEAEVNNIEEEDSDTDADDAEEDGPADE